jgi:DNA excision repair protein ERCC-5
VITDDSDVFLFGASNVYRNVFETRKYAEVYTMLSIKPKFGIERSELISIGMLVGSDYKDGIRGIGIVNAMEIVNAFPGGNEGLAEFKDWCWSGSAPIKRPVLPKTESDDSVEEVNSKMQAYRKDLFKWKHRTVRQSWHVPITSLSLEVRKGYARPLVDSNNEKISWQAEIVGIN